MNEACLKTTVFVQECTRRVKDEHEHRPKSICTNLLYLQLAQCKSRFPKTYDISKHSLQFKDGRITK